jgi:hypothetical protein
MMKLADIDRVNHLVGELGEVKGLIALAERSEPAMFQLFIEAPGDASLRMSQQGASTTHSRGVAVTDGFLASLKQLAVAELRALQQRILAELTALGVDTGD